MLEVMPYIPLSFQDEGTGLFNADRLGLFRLGSQQCNEDSDRLLLILPISINALK